MRDRAATWLLLLLAAGSTFAAAGPAFSQDRARPAARPVGPRRVQADVCAMASQVALSAGRDLAYVGSDSSVNFIRSHAWILTVWVADAPAYGGEYFVLSELDGRRTGELLAAPGPEGTRTLEGDALRAFLERVELDPRPIEEAFERFYAPAARRF